MHKAGGLTRDVRGRDGRAASGAGIWERPGHWRGLVQTRRPEDWLEWQLTASEAARHLELSGNTDELEQRKPWRTYAGWDRNAPRTGKPFPRDPQRRYARSI